jgi:NitT/TauT family transport system permease protein
MAADPEAFQVEELTGLDNLDLAGGQPRSRTAGKVWAVVWPKLLAVAIGLGVWQLIHLTGWKKYALASPGAAFSSLWDQMQHAQLWSGIGITARQAVTGFVLALVIGSVIGALVSRIRPLRAAVGSLITALQTVPSVVWAPLGIILFGLSTSTILFVITLAAAPSIANGLIAGADLTPPLLLRVGKTMGLRRLSLYQHVILPASLPAFVAGLKQGWAFAWHGLLAGEIVVTVANQPSLGTLITSDQDQADMAGVTSIIIVILVLGVVVDMLFSQAERTFRRRRGLAGT